MTPDKILQGYSVRRIAAQGCPNFTVSGGHLSNPTQMGWLISDHKGFTTAVSCDSTFVEAVASAPKDAAELRDKITSLLAEVDDLKASNADKVNWGSQRLALADRLATAAQALYSDMDWGDTYPQISTPEDADKLGQNLGLALHEWFKK